MRHEALPDVLQHQGIRAGAYYRAGAAPLERLEGSEDPNAALRARHECCEITKFEGAVRQADFLISVDAL